MDLSKLYQLGESICNFWVSGVLFHSILLQIENSVDLAARYMWQFVAKRLNKFSHSKISEMVLKFEHNAHLSEQL